MKQEDKELLLKDLCSRLSYDVRGFYKTSGIEITNQKLTYDIIGNLEYKNNVEFKPYLFPLLSMTEKQKEELLYNYIHNDIYFDDFTDYFLAGELWHDICVSLFDLPQLIDWLNKNHFDWRGLIPKGLANDATGLNIY